MAEQSLGVCRGVSAISRSGGGGMCERGPSRCFLVYLCVARSPLLFELLFYAASVVKNVFVCLSRLKDAESADVLGVDVTSLCYYFYSRE
jgi:hypothetical protein